MGTGSGEGGGEQQTSVTRIILCSIKMGNCISHVNISLTVGDKIKRQQTPGNLATAVKEKGEPRWI